MFSKVVWEKTLEYCAAFVVHTYITYTFVFITSEAIICIVFWNMLRIIFLWTYDFNCLKMLPTFFSFMFSCSEIQCLYKCLCGYFANGD